MGTCPAKNVFPFRAVKDKLFSYIFMKGKMCFSKDTKFNQTFFSDFKIFLTHEINVFKTQLELSTLVDIYFKGDDNYFGLELIFLQSNKKVKKF